MHAMLRWDLPIVRGASMAILIRGALRYALEWAAQRLPAPASGAGVTSGDL